MWAVCLSNTLGSVSVAVSGFTLGWTHSIEKVRWEEHWRVEATALVLEAVQVRGFGAGMEPPPEAVLKDGVWRWTPGTRHELLRLTRSGFTDDYDWCEADGSGCRPLGRLLAPDGGVTAVKPCDPRASADEDEGSPVRRTPAGGGRE